MAGRAQTWREWSWIGLAYILPWFGLGLFGRQGNITLILSALLLAGWLFRRMTKMLDLPLSPMYNEQNSLREE
jgi:hypothetical protein